MLHISTGHILAVAVVALVAGGCATSSRVISPTASDECRLAGEGLIAGDTVRVGSTFHRSEVVTDAGLWDYVDQLVQSSVSRRLYRIDCAGNAIPDLASRWQKTSTGWQFHLNEAEIVDGSWPDARTISESWNKLWVQHPGDTAFSTDDQVIVLETASMGDAPPRYFATSEFDIARLDGHPPSIQTQSVTVSSGDARDALGSRSIVDVLISDDPDIVAFAVQHEQLLSTPLPFDRTYSYFDFSARTSSPDSTNSDPDSESNLAGGSLFVDALRHDSRPSSPPYWTNQTQQCRNLQPDSIMAAGSGNIIGYLRNDTIAKALAERIVALSGVADSDDAYRFLHAATGLGDTRLRAVGFTVEDASRRIRTSSLRGFVAMIPLAMENQCQAIGSTFIPTLANRSSSVVPLVDVRSHLLTRDGVPAIFLDGFGHLYFERAGR